jgi:hypothetical protein
MKGMQGLIIAVALGVAAIVLNWLYLEKKGNEFEYESFVGIAPDTVINPGDTFMDSHFVAVPVPKGKAGTLNNVAVRWDLLSTVSGMKSSKSYTGNELLLQKDLETPPEKLDLRPGEQLYWVPIDPGMTITSQITPGDEIFFMIRKVRLAAATPPVPTHMPADGTETAAPAPPPPPPEPVGYTETIGPFRVLAVGNRLGKPNVHNARMAQVQENVITIPIKYATNGELDPLSKRLTDALFGTNARDVRVSLRPKTEK